MDEILKIFMAGMVLANGPCLFICVPVILPCIAGLPHLGEGAAGWKTGLKFACVFSAARLTAYSVLGYLSVAFYQFLFGVAAPRGAWLQPMLGLLIIGLGISYAFNIRSGSGEKYACCSSAGKVNAEKSVRHMIAFGLLVGFSPCPPLLAMLTYISATAGTPLRGLIFGLVFGLGTIITPLIPLGTAAGFFADKARKFPVIHLAVKGISALILIYFGARLIFR